MPVVMLYGAIAISLATSVEFLSALIMAYWSKDAPGISNLVQAVIVNTASVVGFWIGSSVGSMRKTELQAAQTPPQPPRTTAP